MKNKYIEFASTILEWAGAYRGLFGYSQSRDKLLAVLDRAVKIGGFGAEVAWTVQATIDGGVTVARCSFKQAMVIARTILDYKETTYTVTYTDATRTMTKTSDHICERALKKLLEHGLVLNYHKND